MTASRAPGDAVAYAELLAGNLRAERARAGLSQRVLAERMSALGFKWAYQSCAKSEHAQRPVTAAEVVGLCLSLGTTLPALLAPAGGGRLVLLPGGAEIDAAQVRQMAYGALPGRMPPP